MHSERDVTCDIVMTTSLYPQWCGLPALWDRRYGVLRPAIIADIKADLELRDGDAQSQAIWPPLALQTQQASISFAAEATSALSQATTPSTSTSTKRPMDHASDTSSELSSPAAKTSRHNETSFSSFDSWLLPPSPQSSEDTCPACTFFSSFCPEDWLCQAAF